MPMVKFEGLLCNFVWAVTAKEVLQFFGCQTVSCIDQALNKVFRTCGIAWKQHYEVGECIQRMLNYSHRKRNILLVI